MFFCKLQKIKNIFKQAGKISNLSIFFYLFGSRRLFFENISFLTCVLVSCLNPAALPGLILDVFTTMQSSLHKHFFKQLSFSDSENDCFHNFVLKVVYLQFYNCTVQLALSSKRSARHLQLYCTTLYNLLQLVKGQPGTYNCTVQLALAGKRSARHLQLYCTTCSSW